MRRVLSAEDNGRIEHTVVRGRGSSPVRADEKRGSTKKRPASSKQSGSTASSKHPRRAAVKKHPRRAASRPRTEQRAVGHDMLLEGGAQAAFDPDLRHRMISEAAYYLYTQRSYAEGYNPDDWLQAEAQIDNLIMNPGREDTTEVSALLASP